jgi:hypothetical protein
MALGGLFCCLHLLAEVDKLLLLFGPVEHQLLEQRLGLPLTPEVLDGFSRFLLAFGTLVVVAPLRVPAHGVATVTWQSRIISSF